MTQARRKFLFLIDCSPWQQGVQACIDKLLTAAVLDQDVAVCFTGAGLMHLLPDQNGGAIGMKTLADQYPAVSLYGVEQIYIEAEALSQWGVASETLTLPAQALTGSEIAVMIREVDVVQRCI